ncbi:hypothetical protein ACP70R_048142 [Stipagrostis hirtigluma subsp. patula]
MPSAAETAAELEKAAKAKADAEVAAKAKAAMEEAARAEQARQRAADQATFAAMQEAAAVAALHAQAVAVQNIKAFIPIVLDITTSNYTKWKTLFLDTLGNYELADHVLEDVPAEDSITPHWTRMDCTVRGWLYSTISADLLEIVMDPEPTARSTWLGLEEQFVGNKEQRAMILDAQFRIFIQGDLSITEYCHRMNSMADELGDLGEHVLDRTLVLNIIRGLNERYEQIGTHIQRSRPFPSFVEARVDLQLAEITLTTKTSSVPALAATTVQPANPPSTGTQGSGASGGNSGGGTTSKGGKKGGKGEKKGNNNGGGWPTVYNTWTRTFQVWSSSTGGTSGVRSGAPQQQQRAPPAPHALAAFGAPGYGAPGYGAPGFGA